jgi:topoisomerase-4 subunit B
MEKKRPLNLKRDFLIKEYKEAKSGEDNGTMVTFIPDETVFKNLNFILSF